MFLFQKTLFFSATLMCDMIFSGLVVWPTLFLSSLLTQDISQLLDQGGITRKEVNAEEALLVVGFLMVWIKAFLLVPISHSQQEYLLLLMYKFPLSNGVFHTCTTNHRPFPTSEDHTAFL